MDLIESIQARHSVRSFTSEEVPEEVVLGALQAANLAPSAGNLQARAFIVVRDAAKRRRLAEAALGQRSLAEAPLTIVCCADLERIASYGARGRELYCLQDVAAAAENLLLYITAQGYGSCWIGAFDEGAVAGVLSLPAHVRPLTLLPVGRPRLEEKRRGRLRIEELVHWEEW